MATLRGPVPVQAARVLLLVIGVSGLLVFALTTGRALSGEFVGSGVTPAPDVLSDAAAWSLPQLLCGVVGLCVRPGHPWAPWGAGVLALAMVAQSVFMVFPIGHLALETGAAAAAWLLLLMPAARRFLGSAAGPAVRASSRCTRRATGG